MSEKGSEGEEKKAPEQEVTREEMVGYLMSTGRIKSSLANSLYDQGLDDWKELISREDFTEFRGIGVKMADALNELSILKKEEMEKEEPFDLRSHLEGISGIGPVMVDRIFSAGYDTVALIKDAGVEGLIEIKGIGPGIASDILESLKDVEVEVPKAEPEIEEATGMAMVGEEEEEPVKSEEGFISKLFRKIRALFKGEEKPQEETPDEEAEEKPEEEESEEETGEEPEEEEAEEGAEEKPEEEEPTEEGPPSEEVKEKTLFKPVSEEETEEEPEEEEPEEEAEEEPEEEEPPEEEPSVEKPKETGFLAKLKGMFSGKEEEPGEGKTEEEVEEEPGEEKPQGEVEEETAEEEKSEEEVEEEPEEEEAPPEAEAEEPEEEETEAEITDFHDIPGIDDEMAERIEEAGYLNMDELKEAVWEDLTYIEGIDEEMAKKIVKAIH